MSCPYFVPLEQMAWPNAPKLPLGDAYKGCCRADPARDTTPPADGLIDLCNLGYARGRCPCFPAGAGPDAVRFAVASHAGDGISILWVRERDHHPYDHGRLEYSAEADAFAAAPADAILLRQAQAYVASYARRAGKVRSES